MSPGPSIDLVRDPAIRRILVIKWSAMGDVALASAAIESLARAFPGRAIDLDTLAPWDQLYRHDPRLDRVQAFALRTPGRRALAAWQWLRQVRRRRYDLVVDLQTTDRSRLMLAALIALGAPIRHRLGNKAAFPYTIAPAPSRAPRHALQILDETLAAAGIRPCAPRPVLHPSAAQRARAAALRRAAGLETGRFAVLLPGCQAAGYLKRWGRARYAALARQLLDSEVERVVLLGGPDELDECAAIAATDRRIVDLCGRTELLEVTAICESARLVIGNDTGTGHLASACETPLLVICGPTDPRRVRPAGPQVHGLQADLPCINCYRKHCAHHSCMRLLTPATVLAAARAMLASQRPGESLQR